MARPKLGEGETLRLHIKFSDEEASAVDDWRFSNRVENRSEAIRRLVQIGLRADARSVEIAQATSETFDAATALWTRISEDINAGRFSRDDLAEIALTLFDGVASKSLKANKAAAALLRDTNAFHQKTGAEDEIEKAMKATEEYKALAKARSEMGIFE